MTLGFLAFGVGDELHDPAIIVLIPLLAIAPVYAQHLAEEPGPPQRYGQTALVLSRKRAPWS